MPDNELEQRMHRIHVCKFTMIQILKILSDRAVPKAFAQPEEKIDGVTPLGLCHEKKSIIIDGISFPTGRGNPQCLCVFL